MAMLYKFLGTEYDTSIKGKLVELLNSLSDYGIINREVEEAFGQPIIVYYDGNWKKIGTSKNIQAVLNTLVEEI